MYVKDQVTGTYTRDCVTRENERAYMRNASTKTSFFHDRHYPMLWSRISQSTGTNACMYARRQNKRRRIKIRCHFHPGVWSPRGYYRSISNLSRKIDFQLSSESRCFAFLCSRCLLVIPKDRETNGIFWRSTVSIWRTIQRGKIHKIYYFTVLQSRVNACVVFFRYFDINSRV